MIPHFYCHPSIHKYSFGPNHPLKPERLKRTLQLLDRMTDCPVITDTDCSIDDLLRVHSEGYVDAVRLLDSDDNSTDYDVFELRYRYGFSSGDNPAFPGMFNASLAYAGSTAAAARAVRDGAPLAFSIGGGLHHAMRERASGFCIFDDPAMACSILRDRFQKVAYVDIDVHHGDGVERIFCTDPSVLTCSIHEEGRTLFPGTGAMNDMGLGASAINVPLQAKTTGEVWLDAFEQTILPALEAWQPEAIVLQLGTDTHYLDPLGHIKSTQQHWLSAARHVKELGLPLVAVGGGGYNITTVPRMWVSAILTLANIEYEDQIPEDLAAEWGVETLSDHEFPTGGGRAHADEVVSWLREHHEVFRT